MKKINFMFVGIVILALVASACTPPATPPPAPPASTEAPAAPAAAPAAATNCPWGPGKKVAALLPGLVTDFSWNQWGFEGLTRASKECGFEVAYTENVTQDAQLEIFRSYAAEGYSVIFGHGGEFGQAAFQVGKEYPDVKFVWGNGLKGDGAGVTGVSLDYYQDGYFAGVIACQVTKSKKIGIVIGEMIAIAEEALKGYTDGAQTCGNKVEIVSVVTLAWADVQKANEAAKAMIADGVDVLFHLLDAADAGVFAAAQDGGVLAVGSMSDQSSLGPKAVVGSIGIKPDQIFYSVLVGTIPLDGGAHIIGLNVKNGLEVYWNDDVATPEVIAKTEEIIKKVASGALKIP